VSGGRAGAADEIQTFALQQAYLRARYYDPTTGQFLSRDPLLVFTRASYGFTADNPTNRSDPTGECGLWGSDTCVGDAAGAVSSGFQSVADAITSNAGIIATVASSVATVASGVATGCAVVAAIVTLGTGEGACAVAGLFAVGAGALSTAFDGYLAANGQLRGGWAQVGVDAFGTLSGGAGDWLTGTSRAYAAIGGFACSNASFDATFLHR